MANTRTRANGALKRRVQRMRRAKRAKRAKRAIAERVTQRAQVELDHIAERAQQQGREALKQFQRQARARPNLALGAAVGVGVLAGILFSHRHH